MDIKYEIQGIVIEEICKNHCNLWFFQQFTGLKVCIFIRFFCILMQTIFKKGGRYDSTVYCQVNSFYPLSWCNDLCWIKKCQQEQQFS